MPTENSVRTENAEVSSIHEILVLRRKHALSETGYFAYPQRSRTHLALAKDAPESRAVEKPERGRIVAIPQVGGLHHRYQRQAA